MSGLFFVIRFFMEKLKRHVGILKHAEVGYAEELLLEILRTQGMVARVVNPCDVAFGGEDDLPDVVLARCELSTMSDRAFPAYLNYFDECRWRGVPVVNPEQFLLYGQDKYRTHVALRRYMETLGLADNINPPTWVSHNRSRAIEVALREVVDRGSVVIKHPCSGRGEGVYLVRNEAELLSVLSRFEEMDPILIQRTIQKEKNREGGYRDIRMWVCRDDRTNEPQVVAACYRNAAPGSFLTNIDQGASPSQVERIDDELAYYAGLVMDATSGDVAGLDFVRDVDGRYWFEEVNIAFETPRSAVEVIGDEIWRRVACLLEARMTEGSGNIKRMAG